MFLPLIPKENPEDDQNTAITKNMANIILLGKTKILKNPTEKSVAPLNAEKLLISL